MRATGAKVFFSTIIPYHSDYPNKNMIERVDEYNNAIVPVLEKEGVVIDDLNKVVTDNITNNLICSDLIHLNENVIEVCANHIAEFLESYL